jgi:hypothetical protein
LTHQVCPGTRNRSVAQDHVGTNSPRLGALTASHQAFQEELRGGRCSIARQITSVRRGLHLSYQTLHLPFRESLCVRVVLGDRLPQGCPLERMPTCPRSKADWTSRLGDAALERQAPPG